MADNEILKDAELEEVVGGSGMECIGLMTRLQAAGLAKFNTPLVAGNEAAAANELKTYLNSFTYSADCPVGIAGSPIFGHSEIYADGRANDYNAVAGIGPDGPMVHHYDADSLIEAIKHIKGMWF